MPRASLHTLGCRLNQAETAIIAKSLVDHGFEIVDFGRPAELTVINTCTVTEQADSKCRQAVRYALRSHPLSFVAVVGCYAQMAAKTIAQISGVDLVVGNEFKLNVVDYLDGLEKRKEAEIVLTAQNSGKEFTVPAPGLYYQNTRANLKLQDGCNSFCSFCIIPTARGRARSRQFDDIFAEARALVVSGHKEIVLTGVNIGTYKNDGNRLLDVIRKLEEIPDLERIRISSIEPTTVGTDLVRHMGSSEKLCHHLHVPLQSGDDKILKAMRRRHTIKAYAQFIEWTAKMIPDIGIGTDVMVGFPGEGEEEFKNTKKAVADLPISFLHVFTYSDRKGAASFDIHPKVSHQEKKQRTNILIEMGRRKQRALFEKHLGRTAMVLFETREDDFWTGYSGNYIRVKVISDGGLRNRTLPIHLTSIDGAKMIGNLATRERDELGIPSLR